MLIPVWMRMRWTFRWTAGRWRWSRSCCLDRRTKIASIIETLRYNNHKLGSGQKLTKPGPRDKTEPDPHKKNGAKKNSLKLNIFFNIPVNNVYLIGEIFKKVLLLHILEGSRSGKVKSSFNRCCGSISMKRIRIRLRHHKKTAKSHRKNPNEVFFRLN